MAALLSLGYGGAISSVLWVQAIFDFVGEVIDGTSPSYPALRLEEITVLDPHWEEPYHFAALSLEDSLGRMSPEAINLVSEGVARFPGSWKLRLYLGMALQAWGQDSAAAAVLSPLVSSEAAVPGFIREFAVSAVHDGVNPSTAFQRILLALQVVEDPVSRGSLRKRLEKLLGEVGLKDASSLSEGLEESLRTGQADRAELLSHRIASALSGSAIRAPESGSSRSR